MQRIGHQDAVDIFDRQRNRHEITRNDFDERTLIMATTAGELLQRDNGERVTLDCVDAARWAEQGRKCHREGPMPGAKVGPDSPGDTGRDETSSVTSIHSRRPRGNGGASLLERREKRWRVIEPERDAACVAIHAGG